MRKHNFVLTQAKSVLKLTLSSAVMMVYSMAQANPIQNDTYAVQNGDVQNGDVENGGEQNSIQSQGEYIAPLAYLDPIVVTATRSEKNLSDSPIALQVIDKKALQANHAHTLKEALHLLPNVNLVPLHGKTGFEVRMQGFSGDQVLILIDGLPISASTGSTVNLNQYLNTNVEQIEVIQGAASAQYGSSAMGGVINVITQPISDTHASITAEVGTNGSQNPSDHSLDNNRSYVEATLEGALSADGRVKGRLSGSYLDDKGLSVDTDAWPLLKDPSRQKQIGAKVTYTPNINEVSLSNPNHQYWLEASWYEEDDISRFNYFVPPRYLAQQRDEEIQRQRFSVGAKTTFNDLTKFNDPTNTSSGIYKLAGSVLYENYDSQSNTKSGNIATDTRHAEIETTLAQAQLDLPYIYSTDTQSHAIQLGTSWRLDELEQANNSISELRGDDVDRDVIEAYVQDDWMIGDNLEVVIGARYQDDSDFGGHFAPKLAIKQDYYDNSDRKHTFRASIGNGYRVPNLKERYYIFDHSSLGYKVMGNPDLQPETSTSYQLGYQTNINQDVSLNINGFYNDVKHLIQTDNTHPVYEDAIAIYSYDNIDKAETYGADATVGWQVNDKAALNLTYAYLHTKNKTTGSELTYSPEHRVTANLDYQLNNKLQLVQQVRFESKQLVNTANASYSPSWWGLDSRANYSATPNLDLYLAVNNLLDEQREAADANDQRPIDNRQWIVGASYHW